uniref:Uncharacterized protein n=1 Tax=Phasianus colchicus TaxID=9054 RepID=A0A669QP38_PHACC
MPFGAVLAQTGGLGRFQALQVALLAVPILLMAAHNLLQNFSAAVPPHRCRVPDLSARGAAVAPGGASSMAAGGTLWILVALRCGVGVGDTEPCHDGWEYDTSVYVATIVTE